VKCSTYQKFRAPEGAPAGAGPTPDRAVAGGRPDAPDPHGPTSEFRY